jgi:hypothetical protein
MDTQWTEARLDRAAIEELLAAEVPLAVTITLPGHMAAGREVRQDRVRFKNLLEQARAQLAELGVPQADSDALLSPAGPLADADGEGFWRGGGAGIAVFLAPGFFRHYRTEFSLPEAASVDTRFGVKALLPALDEEGRCYVLALSENSARLVLASPDGAAEVELPGAATTLNDYMKLEDREQSLQMHSTGSPQSGNAAGGFHGGGSWHDYEKAQLPGFVKSLGEALHSMLSPDGAPLVVATEQRLFAEAQRSFRYPGLVPDFVAGNFDDASPAQLAQLAWPLARPRFGGRDAKLARLSEVVGTPAAATGLGAVVTAAARGQVDALFLDPQAEGWGSYDPGSFSAVVHPQRESGSVDLLEIAAAEVLRTSGSVHCLSEGEVPGGGSAAALLRWPAEQA